MFLRRRAGVLFGRRRRGLRQRRTFDRGCGDNGRWLGPAGRCGARPARGSDGRRACGARRRRCLMRPRSNRTRVAALASYTRRRSACRAVGCGARRTNPRSARPRRAPRGEARGRTSLAQKLASVPDRTGDLIEGVRRQNLARGWRQRFGNGGNLNRSDGRLWTRACDRRSGAHAGGVGGDRDAVTKIEGEVQCCAVEAANGVANGASQGRSFARRRRPANGDNHGDTDRARQKDEPAESCQTQSDKGLSRAHGAFGSAQICPSPSKEHEASARVSS